MPAVGPGTSIGGRYHLRQRLERTDPQGTRPEDEGPGPDGADAAGQ